MPALCREPLPASSRAAGRTPTFYAAGAARLLIGRPVSEVWGRLFEATLFPESLQMVVL